MELRSSRSDFLATTVLTACAAALLFGMSGIVVSLIAWSSRASLFPVWGAWLVSCLTSACLGALGSIATLTAFGGLVVLHRESREQRGLPYVGAKEPERIVGPVVAALRRLWLPRARLLPGELAEVRSLPEILATLDERGCLDALPFMPEMAAYCGHRFAVHRRVDKVWEYANATGLRRFHNAVLLRTLRCDGGAHGGCQSSCQLIWKEAWLKRPGDKASEVPVPSRQMNLAAHARIDGPNGVRYVCQMTEIVRASGRSISPWNLGHHVRDWVSGNSRLAPILTLVGVRLFNSLRRRLHRSAWPMIQPVDSDTSPHQSVGLQPGQLVRIKSKRDIEATLNRKLRNRGMEFGQDMLSCCGASYRVRARIDRIVHEGTGELLVLKAPSILLEGANANGGVFMAPQNEFYFWREIWLERLSTTTKETSSELAPSQPELRASDHPP